MHVELENHEIRAVGADTDTGFQGVPRQMTTLSEKMKLAGYATAHVGKWDIGMATVDLTATSDEEDAAREFCRVMCAVPPQVFVRDRMISARHWPHKMGYLYRAGTRRWCVVIDSVFYE